ncbi:DUF2121 domain-containing protein [Methanobacterium sp.]|uniref:DUF2121 family protein n=1 Tax=Methanobacterium sp. TaxID=2164 RepID=UPI003159570B
MSLIMSYIGSNGCVMAGDKRRIGFFGDKEKREKLEEYLYSGAIQTDEELVKVAKEQEVTLKISDDARKIRSIDDVVVGEVRFKTPFETKRKRIYGTTNGYIITELSGSDIKKVENGASSIVVFGNKVTKQMANEIIKKHWKSKASLENVESVFKRVMNEISGKTPSVSKDYDIIIKHSGMDKREAQKHLREILIKDVKELQEWREGLRQQLDTNAKSIQMASKIINEGEIGKVQSINGDKIGILLDKSVQALDMEWNVIAGPGGLIEMNTDDPSSVKIGDVAVIENENLCIMRTKCSLTCNVILCRS